MQPNPLAGIMGLLPLLIVMPMLSSFLGGSKQKALTHSPGRSAAKYALAGVGILGGVTGSVVSPILVATLTPEKIPDGATPTQDELNAWLNKSRKANFAVGLTTGIGVGVGTIADGVATMLAKA